MGGLKLQPQPEITADENIVGLHREPTSIINGVAAIAGMEVRYTRERTTGETIDHTPILLLRGYAGVEADYVDLRHSIALSGKEAITFASPDGPGLLKGFHPVHFIEAGKTESRAAYGVMRDIKQNSEHVFFDLGGHSLGADTAMNVALHRPELVRSTILMGSACLSERGLLEMLIRTGIFCATDLRVTARELYRDNTKQLAIDGLNRALHLAANLPRTATEGRQAIRGTIHGKILGVRAQGIKTAAIHFRDDSYSPPEEARKTSHLFDAISYTRGDHLSPQREPDQVVPHIIKVLEMLFPKPDLSLAA